MASLQLSLEESDGRVSDELALWRNLGARFARESAQQRAQTRALVDESRAATQSQLDDISQAFGELLNSHSRSVERSMETHRRASEESLQQAFRQLREDLLDQQGATIRRLEEQVQGAVAEERLAVQEALQSVAEVLRRQRAEAMSVMRSDLAEALAPLKEEMRCEMLAAIEAECRSSSLPASATKLEEGTALAATAVTTTTTTSITVLQSPEQRFRPSPSGAGGEEAEPAGQHEQRRRTSVADTVDSKFTFHESLWNAVLFIGLAEIDHLGSIATLLALLSNAAMQIAMCLIINDNLTQLPVSEDDIEQYRYWRTTVAHNIKFVDQFSWESLAKRVCEFNYAPMSASTIQGLDAIQRYMPDAWPANKEFLDGPPLGYWGEWLGGSGMPVGATMCCLALAIWWMTVLNEMYNIFDMTMAIGLLPQGSTVFSVTDEGFKLEAVSNPRRCLIGAVSLLRAGICVLLGVFGTYYLAATVSLGDLILNAVALEIVLNLDELAFSVCAPASARTLIQSIQPLTAGRSLAYRGLDWKPVFAFLFLTVALVCVNVSLLFPQIGRLTQAQEEICGGNKDFIFGVDMAGLVWAAEPDSEVEVTSTYPFRAVRLAIENEEAVDKGDGADEWPWLTTNWGTVSGDYWSVENIVNLPTEDVSGLWNVYCEDLDESGSRWAADYWRVALEILKDAPGVPTDAASCKDVAGFCNEQVERGVRARQLCPQTCGCDDPTSGLTFVSASLGCPKMCRFSDMYHDKLSELNCTDYSPDEPQTINGTSVMDVFLTGRMEEYITYYGANVGYFMEQGGCPAVLRALRNTWVGDLCVEENAEGLKPITMLCPETCRCDQTNALLCPTACGDGGGGDEGYFAEETVEEAYTVSLFKENHECVPNGGEYEAYLGVATSVDDCALKCWIEYGADCEYFIFGFDLKDGFCFWESAAACESGFQEDSYNVWRIVEEERCAPFDSDACLQESNDWGSDYTCRSSTGYCLDWAKDMQRCCSLSCGSAYLTESACPDLIGVNGGCVYPHDGSDCAA